jgi:hypothetical protein
MARPITLEAIATELTGGVLRPFTIRNKLVYIANDSNAFSMKINFDGTTQESGAFTLKAGEVISDVPMTCDSISVEGIGGSAEFRIMGV